MRRSVETLALVVLVVAGCAAPGERGGAPTSNSSESQSPKIALLSLRPERSSESHVRLYGELRNISTEPLSNLKVVATFRDSAGQLIRSDDFVVEQSPINPGQTAPFMTISRYSDDVASYEVSFKTMFGGEVTSIDQRPAQKAQPKRKK